MIEVNRVGLEDHLGEDAEQRLRSGDGLDHAARLQPQRLGVTGRHQPHLQAGLHRRDVTVQQGQEAGPLALFQDRLVEPAQHGCHAVPLAGEQAQRVACQARDGGGLRAGAADVADREPPGLIGLEQVVEVAADLVGLAGRLVDDAVVETGHLRLVGRQQTALQRPVGGGLLRVQARVVHRQRRAAADVLGELHDVLGEAVGAAQAHHPERAPARGQRYGKHRRAVEMDGRGDTRIGVVDLDLREVGAQPVDACLVGMPEIGQPQRPERGVRGVDGAPVGQPGHHDLGDDRRDHVGIERAGQQIARVGQEPQPMRAPRRLLQPF